MVRVKHRVLERFARDIVAELGAPEPTAERVAESLVAADLRGHTSHGVLRLPLYAEMVEADRLDPTAAPAVEREDETTATVDGRDAFGQVVGPEATALATAKSLDSGVAAVGVRDATHLGRIGEWAERAAEAGTAFAAFVNVQGGSQTVAPPGSADRKLATNPVAFGVPTFGALDFPLVLDIATSQVAHGKIRELAHADEPLPDDWTVTASGAPETDARAFEDGEGALLPLGGRSAGYKGFGLAVVAELFAGIAGDAAVAGQRSHEWADNAALFVAFDPTRFTSEAGVRDRVTALADHLRSADYSPSVPTGAAGEGDDALLPGEAEYRTAVERREAGIPLPDRVADSLRELAVSRGLGDRVPDAFAK
ncbi:Ldh family oxidoreductase (plasmid) [Halorussus limi]|uniref:Ldh family oxidoreductase n=1 Tax=Halorussus limi TaxID=2938695 RepID=A0A8U0I0N2_9EURY|nr:Ldh family oxidoreductase [Halorussus limi]UPV76747.1 Ldh family oxidoreductase [Halorussus limi]